jgi:hypothetical protein
MLWKYDVITTLKSKSYTQWLFLNFLPCLEQLLFANFILKSFFEIPSSGGGGGVKDSIPKSISYTLVKSG